VYTPWEAVMPKKRERTWFVEKVVTAGNEKIHFAGVLVRKNSCVETHGVVTFNDGETSYFHASACQLHQADDQLTAICERVAKLFDLKILAFTLRNEVSSETLALLLCGIRGGMH
jgi:hypothetical protein